MSFKTLLKGSVVALVFATSILVPIKSVSAHTGSASGACVNNVGVITANFTNFGDRNKMLGNITVTVNSQQVDAFVPTADASTKTYKPYQNGTYTVKAAWVLDQNGNKKADTNEQYGFTTTVKIEGCTPKVEKCTVVGKENLNKDDANCKVDMCAVEGKTNLPKNDANCKPDEKCTVVGKTDLNKNDVNCKEDVKPTVLPDTGSSTGMLIALPLFAAVTGFVLKSRSLAKR
jgi:uncharacterized protein (DUF2141 family)